MVMKIRNLAISALAAAFTLAACTKNETTPQASNGLMTVEISLENLNFTKAATDAFLTDQTAVQLNDFKIFLTDGTDLFEAKSLSDVTPVYYYSIASGEALPKKITLDLVPAAVNRVVVVGNVGGADWGPATTKLADLRAMTLDVETEQDYKDLTLYGEAKLEAAGTTHTHSDNTTYGVYTADVELAPLVARFELDGFAIKFSDTNPKFDKVEVKQVALNNYYSATTLNPLAPATLVNRIESVNDKNSLEFFAANLLVTDAAKKWYYDSITGLSLERANANADGWATANNSSKLSYHFFPATEVPQLFIELDVTPTGDTTALPSYIYSKGFYDTNGDAVTFAPGYVYRMNFHGAVNNGDGDIPFEEDDINQIEKCLEITVDVIPWTVVSIYPEF